MIEIGNCKLYKGDCLEVMEQLASDEVKFDLVLTDLPYGTSRCKWDSIIPLKDMWNSINQIVHERTAVLLFGIEPFSSHLRLTNLDNFKYDWIWSKKVGTNFFNANRTPLPSHEIISVFYKKKPVYNPQKRYVGIKYKKPITSQRDGGQVYDNIKERTPYIDDGYRFPLSVIEYKNNCGEVSQSKRVHPTQKPVELLEYLIKSYTNGGGAVLDFTMGSGSTGVACMNTGRKFTGIELEKEYYDIAVKRIKESKIQQRLI